MPGSPVLRVRVPSSLLERFSIVARRRGSSVPEVVRALIEDYVAPKEAAPKEAAPKGDVAQEAPMVDASPPHTVTFGPVIDPFGPWLLNPLPIHIDLADLKPAWPSAANGPVDNGPVDSDTNAPGDKAIGP